MKLRGHVSAFALLGTLLGSYHANAETLEDALVKAYQFNPSIAAARSGLKATDEEISQAMANWRPDVEFTSNIERQHTEDNTRVVPGEYNQTRTPRDISLDITQPLFRGFRTIAEMKTADNDIEAERYRLAGTEQTVLVEAVTNYMNVVRDAAVLELNINNEQVLRRQLEATKDRFEVGELTRTDVSQAEARLSRSIADRIQSEGNLEASRAAYANVVGEAPTSLEEPSMPTDLPTSREEAVELALSKNLNLLAADYDERAALSNVDEQRGALLPTLNLTGSLSRDFESKSDKSRVDTASIGLELTVPLYQQGAQYSAIREAKHTAAEQRMQLEQARRDAIEDATQSWETLVTAQAQIKAFNDQIRAAEIALDGVQREAAVGSRTVLDVLDAEQERLDGRVSLVRAKRDAMVAAYQLKEAIGKATSKELGLPVDLYDPIKNYDNVRNKMFGASVE